VFAWHRAPRDEAREAAVVLCKPFGREAACCHRAYRHLSQRLADAGFHVLTIDYHGTGDASGGDADDERLAAWLGSIRAGTEWTRRNLGLGKVVLMGTRFGALLALEAAARDEIDGLVLFAPPVSGRAWLREVRALRRLGSSHGPKTFVLPPGAEESGGFLLTRATVEELERLEPKAVGQCAKKVLVIPRDDLPGREERLVADLESRGAEVTWSRAPGYAAMMQNDPHKSAVPEAAWEQIAGWLTARYERSSGAARAPDFARVAHVREDSQSSLVAEEVVDIDGLFGILTEPLDASTVRDPAVLLHNIGANPHFGSNRIYVTLARRWASMGFRVLRFDSTGLGDSPASPRVAENCVYSDGAIEDSRRAVDDLARRRGAERFVLLGLCSGAYVAYRAALVDPRVTGLALLNIVLFHWKEGDPVDIPERVHSTHFYRRAASTLTTWRRVFRGEVEVRAIASGLLRIVGANVRLRAARIWAGESDVVENFRALTRRGVEVLLVFADGDAGRDEVDGHLGAEGARFRDDPRFRLEVIEGADHTFSPVGSREALTALLTSHLVTRFASAKPVPA
jgi:pimeloyl-ACP methyl ester carboxylesterase